MAFNCQVILQVILKL